MSDRGSGAFRKYVKMLPIPWKEALGSGMQFFINRQNPESVEFDAYKNGWQITVKTDKENVREAKEFWEEHVEDYLE